MGFINYDGTKEDRYTEVLEYARAQQEEDWNRKEDQKILIWLRDITGNSNYVRLNVEELLKYVVVEYRSMQKTWIKLMSLMKVSPKLNTEQLWKDISLDLTARHINSFHLSPERRDRYLQAFQQKVFKIAESLSPEEHYRRISESPEYRQYFAECFDPTWKGQQVYKWLWAGAKKNTDGPKLLDDFLSADVQMGLFLGLYLHHVILPHDDGWMREIEAERKALSDIRKKIRDRTLAAPDITMLVNPCCRSESGRVQESTKSSKCQENECFTESSPDNEFGFPKMPDSGLDKKRFHGLIRDGGIPNYVIACRLLLECRLPEEIAQTFRQLVDRMPVLQDAVTRFSDVYHADMDQFDKYFAPEALKITAVYLDYQTVGPSEKILKETKDSVFLATRKLLQVVNEKIDEIYRFVTIDTNAEAKALETLMSQDGYVNPDFKIN